MSMMQTSAAFRSVLKSRRVMPSPTGSGVDNIFSYQFDPQADGSDRGPVTREELISLFPELVGLAKRAASPVATSGHAEGTLSGKARAGRILALAAAARFATPRPVRRALI